MVLPPAHKVGSLRQQSSAIANTLADRYSLGMARNLPARLAANLRHLREARGLTQEQAARLAGIPRATWGHLETGSANPTLAVLDKVATAIQVPIEELTAEPRSIGRLYPRGALAARRQGDGLVQQLLPDSIPGMVMDRMEIPSQGRIPGVPHMPGTREYFTCEAGEVVVAVAGERFTVGPGDVLVFRGDQRHSYTNPGTRRAVGYSVVLLSRGPGPTAA
jgi:XRE family transcriptional regulator, regulator of sulfur utilization